MPQTDHDRTIALAGLIQSVDLVRTIARRSQADPDDLATCLASLLRIDAENSAAVYGGIAALRSGLRLLEQQLDSPQDMEPGLFLRKGQPKSLFRPGSSTVVLLAS